MTLRRVNSTARCVGNPIISQKIAGKGVKGMDVPKTSGKITKSVLIIRTEAKARGRAPGRVARLESTQGRRKGPPTRPAGYTMTPIGMKKPLHMEMTTLKARR